MPRHAFPHWGFTHPQLCAIGRETQKRPNFRRPSPPPSTSPTPPLHPQVNQKRPYLLGGRTFTDTDVGYLAFFAAMHAAALIGGPLTFSWDALQVCLAG